MLMMAALPGGITFTAKSTLFKVPILSLIMKTINVQPIQRAQDSGVSPEKRKQANSNLISALGDLLQEVSVLSFFLKVSVTQNLMPCNSKQGHLGFDGRSKKSNRNWDA